MQFLKIWLNPWIVRYPPDTLFLMGLCVLSGITQLLTPQNLLVNVPFYVSVAWSVLLTLGSATTLAGIFWKNLPVGSLIEGAGRSMLWPASFAYGLVLIYDGDVRTAILTLAFGIICLFRALYIKKVYAEWRGLMENVHGSN